MVLRRAKPLPEIVAERAPPEPNPLALGPSHAGMVLDLLPIPAVILAFDGTNFQFSAINKLFRMAGLGSIASESPVVRLLGGRIRRFLESEETHQEIAWQFGSEVDSRHFRVMLARRATSRGEPR